MCSPHLQWTTEGGDVIDIGANASAEGGDDGPEDEVVKVLNVVSAGQLQLFACDKKGYFTMYKSYMKVRCFQHSA